MHLKLSTTHNSVIVQCYTVSMLLIEPQLCCLIGDGAWSNNKLMIFHLSQLGIISTGLREGVGAEGLYFVVLQSCHCGPQSTVVQCRVRDLNRGDLQKDLSFLLVDLPS